MTKEELLDLLKSLMYGSGSYSIEDRGDGFIRFYDNADAFTACFIKQAIKMTGDAFTGITVDSDGRPYMLFTY